MKRIVHISDIHIGHHLEDHLDKAIGQINEYDPDLMIFTGDLTQDGQVEQYDVARDVMERIECTKFMVPGNHDYHHMGHLMFHKYFGETGETTLQLDDTEFHMAGFSSCIPDLDDGRISDESMKRLQDFLLRTDRTAITAAAFHHHLVPPPLSGIVKSLLYNAGDVLEQLLLLNGNMVFCGHRHVPNAVSVDGLFVLNAGTPCKKKRRAWIPRNFTLIEIEDARYDIYLNTVEDGKKLLFTSLTGKHALDDRGEERYVLKKKKRTSIAGLFPIP